MFKPFSLYVGLRYTRAKRRNRFISIISGISMAGIMLGVMALIIVLSVMNGFHKEVRERILGMTSHASILAVGDGIENWREAVGLAMRDPRVMDAAPFVEAQVMLVNGRRVSGALIRGILPEEEPKVSEVGEHMNAGSLGDLHPGEYNIVLGQELAYVLGVRLGDKITVVTPQATITPLGTVPRLKRFTVSGVFEVGMGEYDRGVALVHLKDAAKLQRLGDKVSGVRLKLEDLFQAPQVVRDLGDELPGYYRTTDWSQQHKNFFAALKTEKRMMWLILTIIMIVAAFNIVSTMVMLVTDKQSDIAIMRTLGASPGQVRNIFIIQGATIGVLGTLLGVAAGLAVAFNLETIVGWIEDLLDKKFIDPNIYYISKLPSDVQWSDVGLITLSALLITLLATLYPARRAARTQPAEALRYE